MGTTYNVRLGWDHISFIDPNKAEGEDELFDIDGEEAFNIIADFIGWKPSKDK
jgi:hypothetical protein